MEPILTDPNKNDKEVNLRDRKDTVEAVTPQVLVERIRAGHKSAESELVRRYSRPIMMMLKQRTGDIQRAEDLHQDTFSIVLQRLRTTGIDDPSRIATFLHKTAINLLIGDYRKETRRQTYADTDLVQQQSDGRSDQLRQLIRDEADHAVRTAGRDYESNRIAIIGGEITPGRARAEKRLEQYPEGSTHTVVYNPTDHGKHISNRPSKAAGGSSSSAACSGS